MMNGNILNKHLSMLALTQGPTPTVTITYNTGVPGKARVVANVLAHMLSNGA